MYRAYLRAHDRSAVFAVGLNDLQADPGTYRVVVPRRVAATVDVEADRRRALFKRQTELGLSHNNHGHGTLDARTAASFDPRNPCGCAHFRPSLRYLTSSVPPCARPASGKFSLPRKKKRRTLRARE